MTNGNGREVGGLALGPADSTVESCTWMSHCVCLVSRVQVRDLDDVQDYPCGDALMANTDGERGCGWRVHAGEPERHRCLLFPSLGLHVFQIRMQRVGLPSVCSFYSMEQYVSQTLYFVLLEHSSENRALTNSEEGTILNDFVFTELLWIGKEEAFMIHQVKKRKGKF